MGIMGAFQQIQASKYDKYYSSLNSQEPCKACEGKGFYTNSMDNEFVLLDNSYKCPSCYGSGFQTNFS